MIIWASFTGHATLKGLAAVQRWNFVIAFPKTLKGGAVSI